jgi:hypothetical protein
MTTPIVWAGEQAFRVVGTNLHEDTLRIRSNYDKAEDVYRLRLPTLCITYADMKFVNEIGGEQLRWPDSVIYGPQYFDPPVEINGQAEVERLTWIRGAHRVVIGPEETEIEWYAFQGVVIPRLRISENEPLEATLQVDNAIVHADRELLIDVAQYADGRNTGGLRVVKRHPDWREPPLRRPTYRLWARVLDFENHRPIVEARVALSRWDGDAPSPLADNGAFVPVEEAWTDGAGSIVRDERPADLLEAATLAMDGWRATAKVWRAQPDEPVNLLLTAARLKPTRYPARVRARTRTVYEAAYNLDPGDTLEWLAEAFRYRDVGELSGSNQVAALDPGAPIPLPGWYFVHAQPGDTLDDLAAAFSLDRGWPRTTGRHHRPDPLVPLDHEIVAIPGPDFTVGRTPA